MATWRSDHYFFDITFSNIFYNDAHMIWGKSMDFKLGLKSFTSTSFIITDKKKIPCSCHQTNLTNFSTSHSRLPTNNTHTTLIFQMRVLMEMHFQPHHPTVKKVIQDTTWHAKKKKKIFEGRFFFSKEEGIPCTKWGDRYVVGNPTPARKVG